MSIEDLEEELRFIQSFRHDVENFAAIVTQTEKAILDHQDSENLTTHTAHYKRAVHRNLYRFETIADRYNLRFASAVLHEAPRYSIASPNDFSMTPSMTDALLNGIERVEGAVSHELEVERKRSNRSWKKKAWQDYFRPFFAWYIKPEQRVILIGILAICGIVILWFLGYDVKAIIQIINAIRGK